MKISVVMATYNGERYLEQQLQSILAQTIKPDEIIVCDDASTDGTIAILKKYSQQNILSYVINASRLGVIENFTKAVSLAAPDNYISLSDQDDEWVPDKLEKCAKVMTEIENKQLPCMVYSDLLLIDEAGRVLNKSFRNEVGGQDKYQHNLQTLLFGHFVNGCTCLLNPALRRLFKDIPANKPFHHDDWFALIAYAFGKAIYINESLVSYRMHGNNVTIAANTKPRNRFRSILEQFYKAMLGQDDFLSVRFEIARLFYERFAASMSTEVKLCFEEFLALEGKSYFVKKIAFRRIVQKYQL